jgi:hypothetical protein
VAVHSQECKAGPPPSPTPGTTISRRNDACCSLLVADRRAVALWLYRMSDGIQPRSRLFLSYDVAYPFMVWSWIVLSSFLPVEVPPERVPTWTEVIASCTDVASYRGSLTNSEPATRESRRLPPGSVVVLLLPWTPALEPTTCSSLALWITCKVWCPPCFTSSVHDGLCVREPPFPLS